MAWHASLQATGPADARPIRTSRMAADTLCLSSNTMASPTVRQEYTDSAPASWSTASSSDSSRKSSSTSRTLRPLSSPCSFGSLPLLSRLPTVKLRQDQFDGADKAIGIEFLMDCRAGNGVLDQARTQPLARGL